MERRWKKEQIVKRFNYADEFNSYMEYQLQGDLGCGYVVVYVLTNRMVLLEREYEVYLGPA